ncbi:MAG: toxin-antitoxin system protein [Muribaculaceae bacterium]|nr:toxin-antitoxin system protein [Muribaculaceae bacterium]
MIIDLALEKKAQVFRLPTYLLDKLKELAAKDRRNLNNYVEGIFLDAVYHEPNEITKAAFEEAKDGKLEGPIDTSSVEAMLKSMGL